jgi:hypothetical protein
LSSFQKQDKLYPKQHDGIRIIIIIMWSGGGFWGTAREDQWRRRKDREWEQQAQIRREEQTVRNRMQNDHEDDLRAKDQAFDMTRRLLIVSRNLQDNPKRRRLDNSTTTEEETPEQPNLGDSIQENLLGLSYAMFDTLFGTSSFQSKPFCDFLIRMDERSLAEEIALAAVENSYGEAKEIIYLLNELSPHCKDQEVMLKRLTQLLERKDTQLEGKKVLIDWQAQHGNTEAAFEAALQIPDETARFQKAVLFLEGKDDRGQTLKASCPSLCAPDVIDVFTGQDEWAGFLQSFELPATCHWTRWIPPIDAYIMYAANKKMPNNSGKEVATKAIQKFVKRKLCHGRKTGDHLPGPSSCLNDDEVGNKIVGIRDREKDNFIKQLSDMDQELFSKTALTTALDSLNVNPQHILVRALNEQIDGSFVDNSCSTRHSKLLVSFKCRRCREAMCGLAELVADICAIREHTLTKGRGTPVGCTKLVWNSMEKQVDDRATSFILGGFEKGLLFREQH